MQLLVERQASFGGGMNDSAAATEYAADECESMVNVRPSLEGNTARRRMGSQRTHPTALNSGAQGYGAIEYVTAGGTQHFIVTIGNKVYSSTNQGATWAELATGLDQAYWSMVVMRVGTTNLLLMANGGANIKTYDGTTFGNLAGSPPAGVAKLAVHNDRLAIAGQSGPQIRLSAVGDPTGWTSVLGALTVPFTTHDGDQTIQNLFSYQGELIVWKRDSFGYVEGFGVQTIQVQSGARGISRSVGMLAWRTLQAAGDQGLVWLSERGLEFWQFGGEPTVVSDSVRNFMNAVDYAQLRSTPGLPSSVYVPRLREYRCWLPVDSNQNTHGVVFRPATQRTRRACWLEQYRAPNGGDVEVNGITGYLDILVAGSKLQVNAVTGYLEIDPFAGQQATVDGTTGYLGLGSPAYVPAASFVADTSDAPSQPFAVGYDGFVRRLDTTDEEDMISSGASSAGPVLARLQSRPFFFKSIIAKKKPKRVYVSAKPVVTALSANVDAGVLVDGGTIGRTQLTFLAVPGDKPTPERARVGGARGFALQVDLLFIDDVTVQAIELYAELLGGPL